MDAANVPTFLGPYGYKAAGPSDWNVPPGKSPGAPTLRLAVNGHAQKSSHTFYSVSCQLIAEAPDHSLEWLAQRRLAQLREELHDIVKNELGEDYGPYFSKAPFAQRGGPRGTTERLQKWLEVLAACVNDGLAPPALVAQVLRFLEAPAARAVSAPEAGGRWANSSPAHLSSAGGRSEPTLSPVEAGRPEERSPARREGRPAVRELDEPSTPPHQTLASLSPRFAEMEVPLPIPMSPAPREGSVPLEAARSSSPVEPAAAAEASPARPAAQPVLSGAAPAQAAPASPAAGPEEEQPRGSDMVSMYLAPFGFSVASPEEWRQTPKRSPGKPTLALSVSGHEERDSHTYYDVHCWFVATRPTLHLEWLAERRLASLREELHDVVKNELGSAYADVFGKAPFAKRGGFSGTTQRLQRWLEVLAGCVNDGTAPPALVAQVLLFLGAPAQTDHHAAARGSRQRTSSAGGSESGEERSRPQERGRSQERSGGGSRRPTRESLSVPEQARPALSPQAPPQRLSDAAGYSDEAADATTDDEGANSWSPEKRREGYEKLLEWFKDLRQRLESRLKKQVASQSPARAAGD